MLWYKWKTVNENLLKKIKRKVIEKPEFQKWDMYIFMPLAGNLDNQDWTQEMNSLIFESNSFSEVDQSRLIS